MPGYYKALLANNKTISKENLSIIDKDVRRTPDCLNNPEKNAFIKNVLRAFVKRNPQIGYLQGFNFMVEFFWKKGFNQESAFWLFCHLAENLIISSFFKNLSPLFADVKIFKFLLFFKGRKLFKSLMEKKIDLFFVIHKWFLVHFLNVDNIKVRIKSENIKIFIFYLTYVFHFEYLNNNLILLQKIR